MAQEFALMFTVRRIQSSTLLGALFLLLVISVSANSALAGSMSSATTSPEITLRLEYTFAAPREQVFRAWLDPQSIEKWFIHGAVAHWDPAPVVDARPTGHFNWHVVLDSDQSSFRFRGTYREIEKPQKLVF